MAFQYFNIFRFMITSNNWHFVKLANKCSCCKMDRRELEWDSKPSGLVLVEMKLPKYHTFVIIMVSKSVSPRRDDFFSLRPQKRCF